jgi:hypothetical protein
VTSFVKDRAGDLGALGRTLADLSVKTATILYNVSVPVANGVTSLANAVMNDPTAALQTMIGLGMIEVGAGGEVVGGLFDLSGIGAIAGVPIGVVATGLIVSGGAVAYPGAKGLLDDARGDDRVNVMHSKSSAEPASGSATPDNSTEKLDVAGRCEIDLKSEEQAGGHTIDRHVGLSETTLLARNTTVAFTFIEAGGAEQATAENIGNNRGVVEKWLAGKSPVLAVDSPMEPSLGRVYTRDSGTFSLPTRVRTVLLRDSNGWHVLTSYPVPWSMCQTS